MVWEGSSAYVLVVKRTGKSEWRAQARGFLACPRAHEAVDRPLPKRQDSIEALRESHSTRARGGRGIVPSKRCRQCVHCWWPYSHMRVQISRMRARSCQDAAHQEAGFMYIYTHIYIYIYVRTFIYFYVRTVIYMSELLYIRQNFYRRIYIYSDNLYISKELHQATEKEKAIVDSVCNRIQLDGKQFWAPIEDATMPSQEGPTTMPSKEDPTTMPSKEDDEEMLAFKRMATPLNLDFLEISPKKVKRKVNVIED